MFSLFLFGIYLEKMVGPKLFILIFLLAGFVGRAVAPRAIGQPYIKEG